MKNTAQQPWLIPNGEPFAVLDALVKAWPGHRYTTCRVPEDGRPCRGLGLAHGAYWVRATDGTNQRTLQFAGGPEQGDETPFFGLGVNLGDKASSGLYYLQDDFNRTSSAMVDLSANGGNFVRMFLMGTAFAPEVVNRGVYDKYHALHCYMQEPPIGNNPPHLGNGQNNCWAFDRLLEHARDNDIYFQLCIDPFPPVIFIESTVWETNAYVKPFLDPHRDPATGTYDMKRFFYSTVGGLDPDLPQAVRLIDEGVFYYWKRKYKYIMSRWGYSVNIPIIEPFNEIDQMLTYNYADLRPVPGGTTEQQHYDICPLNKIIWNQDSQLPTTISDWLTDLFDYVRGPVEPDNLETSPLGESNKLVLMSYAGGGPNLTAYHLPFTNENVDLIDAHRAVDNPWDLQVHNAQGEEFRTNFTSNGIKKPFHHGEFTTFGNYHTPDQPPYTFEYGSTLKLFDNYDVSFHNELWASTFGGSFAAGTTWAWDRVFWWPEGLPTPPNTPGLPQHTNSLNGTNQLLVGHDDNGLPIYVSVQNHTLHHHFKPLAEFLNMPSIQALELFTLNFTPRIVEANGIECFYLINDAQDIAIGWVHNKDAYWRKAVYITSQYQHYTDCTSPAAQTIMLNGFAPNTNFKVSYHPTRATMTDLPQDETTGLNSGPAGMVTLDLCRLDPLIGCTSAPLNGTFPLSLTGNFKNHLDTLHSDYAFIIATDLIKRLDAHAVDSNVPEGEWDFAVFPNPTRDVFTLRFMDEATKAIDLLDLSGRVVRSWSSVSTIQPQFSINGLACGAYWVRATDGKHLATKKLLVH